MKFEKSCGAVIFDEGKVLLIKQIAGHWGFPKGHMEKKETEMQTALREVKEETNLDIEIVDEHRYIEDYHPREGVRKVVVFFIAKKIGGEIKIQEEEVKDTEWLSPKDALERLTHESSKNILKEIMKKLK